MYYMKLHISLQFFVNFLVQVVLLMCYKIQETPILILSLFNIRTTHHTALPPRWPQHKTQLVHKEELKLAGELNKRHTFILKTCQGSKV